jgi:hypothetical protein
MNVNLTNVAIEPILALLIGILILLVPRFLNYFVAVYLIVGRIYLLLDCLSLEAVALMSQRIENPFIPSQFLSSGARR